MRWNESEYIKHAQELAQRHLVTKKSLNELAEKFAGENNLNPEEIRTLVRLANVATFQELFKAKNDGDKMIEFDTGDPEAVIRSMVTSASAPPQTANIGNDKLAGEIPDMMREKRLGKKFDVTIAPASAGATEKCAGATEAEYLEKPAREDVVVMTLRKLAEEFTLARISAGTLWEEKLAALTQVFKRAPGYGPAFSDFEKQAWAILGADAAPEMAVLYEELRVSRLPPSSEKVAHLQSRLVVETTPELCILQDAHAARQDYLKMANALVWVEKNMPALGR